MSCCQYAPPIGKSHGPQGERGSALMIVILLLGLMVALLVGNGVVLQRLKVELQLLEQKQQAALRGRTSPGPE
ncbi:MAG: hypothetical protein U1G07_00855 [Verrucomicrobiota bacterium]